MNGSPTASIRQVVVIDDEPMLRESLADAVLRRVVVPVSIRTSVSPLDIDEPRSFSHAIVDLQLSGRRNPADLELRNGLEVIEHLERTDPRCRCLVLSSGPSSTSLELARAAKQTWPRLQLVSKRDPNLVATVATFIESNHIVSSPEFGWLDAIPSLDLTPFAGELQRRDGARRLTSLLLALADLSEPPTDAAVFSGNFGIATQSLHNLKSSLFPVIEFHDPTYDGDRSLESLWLWSHCRRPLLRKVLHNVK